MERPQAGRSTLRTTFGIRSDDVLGITGVAVLVGVWYLATLGVSRSSLPTPWAVATRDVNSFLSSPQLSAYGLSETGFGPALLYTASNVIIAVGIGTIVGTVLGLVSGRVDLVRAMLNPIATTTTTVPVLVAAPFFLVWFGIGRASSLLLVTIYTLVIIFVYSQRASRNLDPVYEENALMLGTHRAGLLKHVVIPGTIPEIFGGIRIALAGAWGLELIAELLGSNHGIGTIILILITQLDTVGMFAAVALICALAVVVDGLLVLVMRRVLTWRET